MHPTAIKGWVRATNPNFIKEENIPTASCRVFNWKNKI